jgi:hypothetical protein
VPTLSFLFTKDRPSTQKYRFYSRAGLLHLAEVEAGSSITHSLRSTGSYLSAWSL